MLRFLLITVFLCCCTASNFVGTMQIKNFVLTKCPGSENDPIKVSNFTIEFGNHVEPLVSGVFSSSVDLISPISVSLDIKRKVVFWIEVPCVENVGSCTYDDICEFGQPATKPCPRILDKNQVPCRCPINKGTYVIPESISNILTNSAIYTGYYKGRVVIENHQQQLGCYDMTFELYDA